MNAKTLLSSLLLPPARLAGGLGGAWARLWAYTRLRARLSAAVPASVVVLGAPEIHGSAHILLGERLFLYPELYLETRGQGRITIGDDAVISRGVHIVSHAEVRIGAGSMIGEYASLRDANHRFGDGAAIRSSGYDARPIVIGRNVWIGRGVAVLAGVTIGDNAVVGANAVVTRDVAAGAVAVGVPARAVPGSAA